MWQKASDGEHLEEIHSILCSIEAIQGKDYSNFVVMMFNSYSLSIAILASCAARDDKITFLTQYNALCFLITNMTVGLSKTMSKLRIAENDSREQDPDKILIDLIRDFKAMAKRMELPYEAF